MVVVEVEQGVLEGERLQLVTGDGEYCSFKGVPYAAPPLGPLRFKAPQPPLKWQGVRKATQHGPVCPQKDIFTMEIVEGNEDCLYLNVYTKNLTPATPLPVMVFIHGGGFMSGSGNEDHYGPDFLVNHDVVLVTINYRLEVLGFLCLDTEDVPGNAGMKDQVAALRWVQKNIKNFGGDPTNVTIFGESAGGSSSALHVLSPMSKGLFKRAIPMSGVPLCEWSVPFHPSKRAFVLGKQLGLETEDPKELLKFLQTVPTSKLINTNPTIMSYEETANNLLKMYHFTPVVEKDFGQDCFLAENPEDLLRNGKTNNVDILIGFTDEESLVGIPHIEHILKVYNRYPEVLVPRTILNKSTPEKIMELSRIIKKHYFGDKSISMEAVKEAIAYFNDIVFQYPINKYLDLLPENNHKKYMYVFACNSERNVYGKFGEQYGITGAAHLDDLMYLFDAKKHNLPIDKNSKSYKMVQQTCALFTNFAKYGNPTPDGSLGVAWPQYERGARRYVRVADSLAAQQAHAHHAVQFWTRIFHDAGCDKITWK